MRRRSGFTLIELLFVVATIAILAAVSVPNFLEAQVRSKIARTRSDMAMLHAAIRTYAVQYDAYPPNTSETLRALKIYREAAPVAEAKPSTESKDKIEDLFRRLQSGEKVPAGYYKPQAEKTDEPLEFLRESGFELARLTTPVAWVSEKLPIDPFQRYHSYENRNEWQPMPFIYINLYDVVHEHGKEEPKADERAGFVLLSHGPDCELGLINPVLGPFVEYDPTNGSTSGGDLVVSGW